MFESQAEDRSGTGPFRGPGSLLLACRDCGLLHRVAIGAAARHRESCARCGALLLRLPPGGFDRPLAIAVAAAILFLLANFYPIFIVNFQGAQSSNLLISGAIGLTGYGGSLAALGVLVGVLSIVMPGVRLGLIVAVLLGLRFGRSGARLVGFGPPSPALAAAWKTAVGLRPWSMLDVYMLGAFVAYSRLHNYVDTTIGFGAYALGALVLMQAVLQVALARGQVWDALADPTAYAPSPGEPWVRCPECDLIVPAAAAESEAAAAAPRAPQLCPRCAARLEPRQPGSLAVTGALTVAAIVLYLPANLLPVMTLIYFGSTDTNTILSGVGELFNLGMWPLALLVFFASIVVPLTKLVALGWFLLAIHFRSAVLLRRRTAFYRLIEFVGRWSNIDIFMISILVALLQFGALTTVEPGIGAVSFAAVVTLTMIATRVFDPRLMWDAALERHA